MDYFGIANSHAHAQQCATQLQNCDSVCMHWKESSLILEVVCQRKMQQSISWHLVIGYLILYVNSHLDWLTLTSNGILFLRKICSCLTAGHVTQQNPISFALPFINRKCQSITEALLIVVASPPFLTRFAKTKFVRGPETMSGEREGKEFDAVLVATSIHTLWQAVMQSCTIFVWKCQ